MCDVTKGTVPSPRIASTPPGAVCSRTDQPHTCYTNYSGTASLSVTLPPPSNL